MRFINSMDAFNVLEYNRKSIDGVDYALIKIKTISGSLDARTEEEKEMLLSERAKNPKAAKLLFIGEQTFILGILESPPGASLKKYPILAVRKKEPINYIILEE